MHAIMQGGFEVVHAGQSNPSPDSQMPFPQVAAGFDSSLSPVLMQPGSAISMSPSPSLSLPSEQAAGSMDVPIPPLSDVTLSAGRVIVNDDALTVENVATGFQYEAAVDCSPVIPPENECPCMLTDTVF